VIVIKKLNIIELLLILTALSFVSCADDSTTLPLSLIKLRWSTNVITPYRVVEYSPEESPGYNNPGNALGFPMGGGLFAGSVHIVSLGFDDIGEGGYIVLEFDRKIINGPGVDFKIFENPFKVGENDYFIEAATIELSLDGSTWYAFPTQFNGDLLDANDTKNPANYLQGYAGVNPVLSNWDDAGSPKPEESDSGGDFFDLENMISPIKENGFYYIKITDAGKTINDPGNYFDSGYVFGKGGFDLDAVVGINYE